MTIPRWMSRGLPRPERLRRHDHDAGFSLIEVIVSFSVFAIVAASAGTAIYRSITASHLSQQRTDAAGVAQAFIANAIAQANKDTVATETGHPIVSSVGAGNASSAKEQFTVSRYISFVDPNQDTCAPGTLFTVNVIVTQAQSGKFLARSDTQVACPPA